MKHYIIDFENLHEDAFKYIGDIDSKDIKIVLVYSEHANKISIDLIKNHKIDFYKVEAANQSADMYICFYIGRIYNLLAKNDEVVILSNDKGYDGLIKTLEQAINISRIGSKNDSDTIASSAIKHNTLVMQALGKAGLDKYDTGRVAKQVATYLKTDGSIKLNTYRYLIKEFGRPAGVELYNSLRPVL